MTFNTKTFANYQSILTSWPLAIISIMAKTKLTAINSKLSGQHYIENNKAIFYYIPNSLTNTNN